MYILTPNQCTEVEDPCGRIREKLEEAEEEDNPIGRSTVSAWTSEISQTLSSVNNQSVDQEKDKDCTIKKIKE